MRIAVIGDIHSRSIWEDVVRHAQDNSDQIVFTGDYIDPYDSTPFDTLYNILNDIIDFKKSQSAILLIGNHDTHYLYDDIQKSTRYDRKNATKFEKIYQENIDLFQYAYQIDNYLFTHAGVSNTWFNSFKNVLILNGIQPDNSNIGDVLNKMGGESTLTNRILNIPGMSRGGYAPSGGITWADYSDTYRDYLTGFEQFVGHSKVKFIDKQSIPSIPGSITYCDVLETPNDNMKYNYGIVEL